MQDLKNTNSKFQSELADIKNKLHKLQNELKYTNNRAGEPSQDKGQLKRNVRHASNGTDTLSATLNNALSEIIELKQIL